MHREGGVVGEEGETVLEGQDLHRDFVQGQTVLPVLRGASIRVRRGERIAIVGASGSGKTTLLQVLGGLDLPTRGTVSIAGERMDQLSDAARGTLRNRAVGFVYQFHHLLPEFTALENVAMPLLVRRMGAREARDRAGSDGSAGDDRELSGVLHHHLPTRLHHARVDELPQTP